MRAILGLVLGLLIASGSFVRAAQEDIFLRVGKTYYVWANPGAPSPFQDMPSGKGSTATVKILAYGTNEWCWVEYDVIVVPPAKSGSVMVYKKRRWMNFAQAISLELGPEIDYAALYPQGYKIIPYDGAGA